jgi:hypothetical protein
VSVADTLTTTVVTVVAVGGLAWWAWNRFWEDDLPDLVDDLSDATKAAVEGLLTIVGLDGDWARIDPSQLKDRYAHKIEEIEAHCSNAIASLPVAVTPAQKKQNDIDKAEIERQCVRAKRDTNKMFNYQLKLWRNKLNCSGWDCLF